MAGKSQANRKPQQLQLRIGQPFKYPLKPGRNTDGFTSMGHGHEDHGHGKMELPDYRQWKVEGTPMEVVQERLAKKGLRDPWARNEAWRFMGGFATPVTFKDVLLRGAKWGFAAFVVALGVEYAFFPPKKNGGHH